MMRRTFLWIIKAAAAGLMALALLCVLCLGYYDIPVHYANSSGATEYRWQASRRYIKGTEGYSFGRTDNDGFINLPDHSADDRIDILLMGSSHMEGMNISPEDNTASVLNGLFGGEKYTYNIGISGHTLLYCAKHLEDAVNTYAPAGYVVIETSELCFPPEDIDRVLSGTLPEIPSHSGGVIGIVQRLPFLRLAYTRLQDELSDNDAELPADPAEYTGWDETEELLTFIGEVCRRHGVSPVIAYHAPVLVDADGTACSSEDADAAARFAAMCEDKGILFVDACGSFVEGYNEFHRLPYGFLNTVPGQGHMNVWGHSLFARCIRDAIAEREG